MTAPGSATTQTYRDWLRRFARTTPGVVGILALVIAVLTVATGLVTAAALNARIDRHTEVLQRAEPFAYAAQNLYVALSAADAAAASAFLSGGIETGPMRQHYQQAVADAAAALADATAGATDAETRTAVADVTAQLAAYTGLVESARANNRQWLPVGSAYLREASTLMQNTLLPGAERIYKRNLATVDADQQAIGTLPFVALAMIALTLVSIVIASIMMRARTNRQFNLGLVTAAVAVLIAGAWAVVAVQLANYEVNQSRALGTQRFDELATARIRAQQARTDETLLLIERGDVAASEKAFYGHIDQLSALVTAGPTDAVDGVNRWVTGHRAHIDAYGSGDYASAVGKAIGPGDDDSPAAFTKVESSLRDAIERTRATMRDHVAAAGNRLAFSPTGTLLLSIIAAAAAVAGLWPRLKEFL